MKAWVFERKHYEKDKLIYVFYDKYNNLKIFDNLGGYESLTTTWESIQYNEKYNFDFKEHLRMERVWIFDATNVYKGRKVFWKVKELDTETIEIELIDNNKFLTTWKTINDLENQGMIYFKQEEFNTY